MSVLTATFRIVTPMFISGADQTKAELRAPSIKGALRFWWRALAWSDFRGDLRRVREEEDLLFGSTSAQSMLPMSLSTAKVQTSPQTKWRVTDWQSYLGYGLIQTHRECIQPGGQIRLRLMVDRLSPAQRRSVQRAVKALGLLGGLGGRSRKAWGSVTLIGFEGDGDAWKTPSSRAGITDAVNDLIDPSREMSVEPAYSAFWARTRFSVGEQRENAEQAHQLLAEQYRTIVRDTKPKQDREQFGLPRDRSDRRRRASPLWLHVHAAGDGGAFPIGLFLPAPLLASKALPGNGQRVEECLNAIACSN